MSGGIAGKSRIKGKKSGLMQKLSAKFILIFAIVLTAVFALSTLMIRMSAKAYMDRYIMDSVYSVRSDIDSGVRDIVDEIQYLYSRIVRPENAGDLDLLGGGKTPATRQNAFNRLIAGAGLNTQYLLDVGYHDGNGYLSYIGFSSPQEDVYVNAARRPNKLLLAGYKNNCVLFSVYMDIELTDTSGTFVFYLIESAVAEVYGMLNDQSAYSFIMTDEGFILSHDDKNYVGKTLMFDRVFNLSQPSGYEVAELDDGKKIVSAGLMDALNEAYGLNCYLVSVMDYEFYYGGFTRMTYILLAIAGALLLTGIILAVIRAKAVTRPVEKLNDTINGVIATGRKSGAAAKEGDEIYQLEKNYDEMINSIFALVQRNKEEMETQRKLELDALQMQINPHFLYNTLDAVVWMAKINKEPAIEKLVVNLAQFFRLSLHRGDKFVTVAEELEIVAHYFEIEKTRFPGRAVLKFETDEKVKGYKTLKLLLQPLVENALKYAFPEGGGQITVRARESGGNIVFEVEDDGCGFTVPSDLMQLKQKQAGTGGYGLYNVNERIKLEYGGACGLTVQSLPGKGTLVRALVNKRI